MVVLDQAVQFGSQVESSDGRGQLRSLVHQVLRLHLVDVDVQQDLASAREQLGDFVVERLHAARWRAYRERVGRLVHGGLLGREQVARDVGDVIHLGSRQTRQVHRFQRQPLVLGAVFLAVEREQGARGVKRHNESPGREQKRVLRLGEIHIVRVEVHPLVVYGAVHGRADAVGAQHLPQQLAFGDHQVKAVAAGGWRELHDGPRVVVDAAKRACRRRLLIQQVALVL